MRKYESLIAFVLIVSLAFCRLATAQPAERYVIDPEHSNIVFLIDHLGFARMIGQFQSFAGEFVLDPAEVESSQVNVTIETASVDTDHEARDEHLRSPDFFNAVEFPEMTFKSREVERSGERTGKLIGDLTLLGATKRVTLHVTFNKAGPHPLDESAYVAGFSARGTIRRSDFGMKYGLPLVGDEVELMIEIEGRRQ